MNAFATIMGAVPPFPLVPVLGVAMLISGIIYVVKPNIYQRWFWKQTDIMQRLLSPERYVVVMRYLGWLFIVVGVILLIIAVWG
jgi:hypothetical protein